MTTSSNYEFRFPRDTKRSDVPAHELTRFDSERVVRGLLEQASTDFKTALTAVFQAAQTLAPEALKQVTKAILNDVDKDRVVLVDVAAAFDPHVVDIGDAIREATGT